MKVIDLIKVCRGNVKFILDGQGPALDRDSFMKLYCPRWEINMEVATVTFNVEESTMLVRREGDIPPPSTTVPLPLGKGGSAAVICEISTIYEDNVQA